MPSEADPDAAKRRFADLAQRTVWGLAVAGVAAAAVAAGGWALAGFAALVSALMAWEIRRMSAPGPFGTAGLLACLAAALACLLTQGFAWRWGLLAAALALAGAAALTRREPAFNRLPFLIGAAYVAVASSALVGLRDDPLYGAAAVVWVALSVVATDVGAYFVGRAVGGPKLWPAVSPGKTWSGLGGGVLAAAAVGAGFSALTVGTLVHEVALVSAVMAVLAQGGDLAESALKRRFGVKDSSRLIPGHGGLLDRLDGLLAAGLVAAVATFLRGKSVFIW
jgi:phosphatidate cytidylyltransferase